MTNHRANLLYASLALLPLAGCPERNINLGDSGMSTGATTGAHATTGPDQEPTTATLPTTETSVGTSTGDTTDDMTGGSTGEDGGTPVGIVEKACHDCGDPETVQVCFCIDNGPLTPVIVETSFACPNDADFLTNARQQCEMLLGKRALSPSELKCDVEISCGTPTPVESACALCHEPLVEHYYCISDTNAVMFDVYACLDDLRTRSFLEAQCVDALGKPKEELSPENFFHTFATCPETDTTGEMNPDTSGSGTTGGDTTGE
jgi:hypothetical protein